VQATEKDSKEGKDAPKEELEQLEHEDELRVKHLHGKKITTTYDRDTDVCYASHTDSVSR
jgi:hypothetical protein